MARVLVTSEALTQGPERTVVRPLDPNRSLSRFANILKVADAVAMSPAVGTAIGLGKEIARGVGSSLEDLAIESDIEEQKLAAQESKAKQIAELKRQAVEKSRQPLAGEAILSELEKEGATIEKEASLTGKTKEDVIAETIEGQGQGKIEDAIIFLRNRKRVRGLTPSEQGVLDRLIGAVGSPAGSLETLKKKTEELAAIPKEIEQLETKAAEIERAPMPKITPKQKTMFSSSELESMAMSARTPEEKQKVLDAAGALTASTTSLYGMLTGRDTEKFRTRLINLFPKEPVVKPLSALDIAKIEKMSAETEKLKEASAQIAADAEEKRNLMKARTRDLTQKNDAMYRGFDYWKASIYQKLKQARGGGGRRGPSPASLLSAVERAKASDLRRVERQHDEELDGLEKSRQKLEDANNRMGEPLSVKAPSKEDYVTSKEYNKARSEYERQRMTVEKQKKEKDEIKRNIERLNKEIETRKADKNRDRDDVDKAYEYAIREVRRKAGVPEPVIPKVKTKGSESAPAPAPAPSAPAPAAPAPTAKKGVPINLNLPSKK